jgi:tripartite-type tricarboxylate transporter receptor subunit TctC
MSASKWSAVPSAAIAIACLVLPVVGAKAQDFYAGKTISILVTSDAGGAYDLYSRLLARHLPKYIPGAPTIIVQNDGGAGGLRGAQQIYSLAPKDGTRIASLRATNMLDATLKVRGEEIDPTKYEWLINVSGDADTCSFWHTSGVRRFEDLKAKEIIVGASGVGTLGYNYPRAINHILQTKMKIVTGYKGTGDRILAMQRGEIHGACGIYASLLTSAYGQSVASGELVVVSQSGLRAHRALPNVPLTQSFASSEEHRRILMSLFSVPELAYPFGAPPGTPKDRVEILRTAFEKVLADPALLEEARTAKLDVNPTPGAQVARIVAEMSDISPELRAQIRAAIGN